jgi:hypothetical protein
MKRIFRTLPLLAIAMAAASGCESTGSTSIYLNNHGGLNGGVRYTLSVPLSMHSQSIRSQFISFDKIAVVLSGNGTFINNGSGTAVLSLMDSYNNILASRNFLYIVQDGIAIPADSSALEAWVHQYSGATAYQVDLMNIPSTDDAGPGISSMTMTAIYDGEALASSTTSWERNVCTLPPCYVDVPIE